MTKKSKKEFLEFLGRIHASLKDDDGDDDSESKYNIATPIKFKNEEAALAHIQSIMTCDPGDRVVMHTTDGDKDAVFWKFDDDDCRVIAFYPDERGRGFTRCLITVSAVSVAR